MTYKQLLEQLKAMPKERLDDDATVWNYYTEEFFPVGKLVENKEHSPVLDTNVLDYGHFVLEINN